MTAPTVSMHRCSRCPGSEALAWALACSLAAAALAPLPACGQESGDEAESVGEAIRRGTVRLALRYRYEFVDEVGFAEDAHASTLRTTLGYGTLSYRGFDALVEAENVAVVGDDLYDNRGAAGRANDEVDRPVVADPALTEINQAYLRYRGHGTTVTVGRQEIGLGDERFVGPVGWRQNHQSFDAVRVVNRSLERFTLGYAYVDEAHRIFGDDKPMSTHLLDGTVDLERPGTLTVYGHLVDFDRAVDEVGSTSTLGLELRGQASVAAVGRVLWEAEYALQRDAGDNPRHIDADYLHLVAGGAYRSTTVRLGWEKLGGSPEDGQFNTPLATLHKWNGWADKFLSTPARGLRDLYVAADIAVGEVRSTLAYHDFGADSGDLDYGSEFDVQLLVTAPWDQVLALHAAFYDAEQLSADTVKIAAFTTWGF